jgi:site-specific DNA-cytosine methylase
MSGQNIKFLSIVPLIGGFTLGAEKKLGKKPEALVSYPPFAGNDSQIVNHYGDEVPYIVLSDDESDIQKLLQPYKNIDIVTSTCPCAGLSQLNSSKSGDKARGADAAQNQWMYRSTEDVLKFIQPTVLVGENAPALYTNAGVPVAEKLREIGKKYGYAFSLFKTSTAFHGIPQNRQRTFYFFWKGPHAPEMEYYNKPKETLAEYLANVVNDADEVKLLTEDIEKDTSFLYARDVIGPDFRQKIAEHGKTMYQYLLETNTLQDYIDYLEKNGFDTKAGKVKAMKAKVEAGGGYWDDSIHVFADTINAIAGRILTGTIHPTENRWFTTTELLHLMGMPEDFELVGGRKNLNMIAQNVPTVTAGDMAEQAAKFCTLGLKSSGSSFNRQDNTKQTIQKHDVIEFV